MKNLMISFFKDEEGGADALVVAAILVVLAITIAVFFGGAIKTMVGDIVQQFTEKDTDIDKLSQPMTTK